MNTLIELYDERPLENVLGVEVFRPERVVYICARESGAGSKARKTLQRFFLHRGLEVQMEFLEASRYEARELLDCLQQTVERYPDCALDITGGSDAALFAAGLLCAEHAIPVFTYSRRKNCFFEICSAPFQQELPCGVSYSVEDCFMMAGGAMQTGRVDNNVLDLYLDDVEAFFRLYLSHRRQWTKIVTYMQRVSQVPKEQPIELTVQGSYQVKGERNARIDAPENALRDMEKIGLIRDLRIDRGRSVAFAFRDAQIRSWLRDVGSVLELYVYKACLDTQLFDDVRCSAIVNWEVDAAENVVSNELDVMAARGVTPVFISCKTCDVKTESLNELAVLRDRFGGEMAKAAIVTAEQGGSTMRRRAAELNIDVIDLKDLSGGLIGKRLRNMMQRQN